MLYTSFELADAFSTILARPKSMTFTVPSSEKPIDANIILELQSLSTDLKGLDNFELTNVVWF